MNDDPTSPPTSIEELLDEITNGKERLELLWIIKDYTDTQTKNYIVTYEQFVSLVDKYIKETRP